MTFCYLYIKYIIIFAKTIAQNQLMNPLNTSVLLIYTGGTIGMIENAATGALENFNFEQLQKFNFPIDTYQLILQWIRRTWNRICGGTGTHHS